LLAIASNKDEVTEKIKIDTENNDNFSAIKEDNFSEKYSEEKLSE